MSDLLSTLREVVKKIEDHRHPEGSDLYCLNLTSWIGDHGRAILDHIDSMTKQRRAIALSTLAVLKRLEWAGEHGACLECRACPRCDRARGRDVPREPLHLVAQLRDYTLGEPEHRDGCALKAEIDRFEKETST